MSAFNRHDPKTHKSLPKVLAKEDGFELYFFHRYHQQLSYIDLPDAEDRTLEGSMLVINYSVANTRLLHPFCLLALSEVGTALPLFQPCGPVYFCKFNEVL
jgi:hypothetical protein